MGSSIPFHFQFHPHVHLDHWYGLIISRPETLAFLVALVFLVLGFIIYTSYIKVMAGRS